MCATHLLKGGTQLLKEVRTHYCPHTLLLRKVYLPPGCPPSRCTSCTRNPTHAFTQRTAALECMTHTNTAESLVLTADSHIIILNLAVSSQSRHRVLTLPVGRPPQARSRLAETATFSTETVLAESLLLHNGGLPYIIVLNLATSSRITQFNSTCASINQ